MAETYDDIQTDPFYANQYDAYEQHLKEHLHLLVGDVLDLGCGTGIQSIFLAPTAASVTGIDLSAGLLARAQAKSAYLANVHFIQGNASHLPFSPKSFDAVISYGETLSHIYDIERVFDEVGRVLRPGGVFLFSVVNKWNLGVLRSPKEFLAAIRTPGGQYRTWHCVDDQGHPTQLLVRTFSRVSVERLCRRIGLAIRSVQGIHVTSLVIPLGWQTRHWSLDRSWRRLGALDRRLARRAPIATLGFSAMYATGPSPKT
jgi:ubiquinone/menaquinone biosynthesis C-methylase UbiE